MLVSSLLHIPAETASYVSSSSIHWLVDSSVPRWSLASYADILWARRARTLSSEVPCGGNRPPGDNTLSPCLHCLHCHEF